MNDLYIIAPSTDNWVRPTNWLPIDHLVSVGQERIVCLVAIENGVNNVVGVLINGINYTVDWGDGNVNNYTAGSTNQHTYDFSTISSTLTNEGYKQVIVQIYPTTGGQQFNNSIFLDRDTVTSNITRFLDIRISAPLATGFQISQTELPLLKKFVWLGTHQLFSIASILRAPIEIFDIDMNNLGMNVTFQSSASNPKKADGSTISVNHTNTSPVAYNSIYENCNIRNFGNLTHNGATNFQQTFLSARKLLTMGNVSSTSANQSNSMFNSCFSLTSIGTINLPAATQMSNMFNGCIALGGTVAITSSSSLTNITSIIQNCIMLKTFTLSECTGITTTTTAFSNAANLTSLRLPNIKVTFSVSGTQLGQAALVTLFNDLATVVGQTLTISNTPGAPLLTAPERAIATGKGWTLVG